MSTTTRLLPALTLLTLLGCATSNSSRENTSPRALDGSRYQVHIEPDAAAKAQGESAFDDWLIFDNGRMSSSVCEGYGFKSTPYSVDAASSGWSFETSQHADGAGDSHWQGTIRGKEIEGQMQVTHPGKPTAHTSFHGTRGRSNN